MSDSITEEFVKYRRVIASLLHKIRPAASVQDIEDILQDTFINTYQSSLKQEIRYPKAFMVKTAIRLANRCIQIARRSDATDAIEEFSDESLNHYASAGISSFTERDVLQREDFTNLCEAINQLPAQCRKVFILKKIYGYSQREIAEKLSISESTVEKHVAKGLLRSMKFYKQSTTIVSELQPQQTPIAFSQRRQTADKKD
jgi:RNA polymerase sigma-70 factor (ECF subfamily)